MSRIVVFDSGFGSLSIIKSIHKHTKAEIIYFADHKNYPYGKKTKTELEKIIKCTIDNLQKLFSPDLIIVGSNTPSLLLGKLFSDAKGVVGVLPPILQAEQITKTNSIALLVTSSVAKSMELKKFIQNNLSNNIRATIIDASELVDLVESGAFIHNKKLCINKINSVLQSKFTKNKIDVATLSSTHLPFLLLYFQKLFPQVSFLDPADMLTKQIISNKPFFPATKNILKIFSSGNTKKFQKELYYLGIRKPVHALKFL